MPIENKIYFDHSATTPLDSEILKVMLPYFSEKFGNPSSIHSFGQDAMLAVEKSKTQAANFLNAQADEIIFTSGATEANNLAIFGLIESFLKKYPKEKPHIITSMIEHDSVMEPFATLAKKGCEVSYLPVDSKGVIMINELEKTIKDNTALVSLMYVNAEIGSIQPIEKTGQIIKKINIKRLKSWQHAGENKGAKPEAIIFHTDATQAANFFSCNVKKLGVDLLSLSGHKIYGPKGIGLLYAKKGTAIAAQQLGGHHQGNRRSGTLNTPSIAGLGCALAKITPDEQAKNNKKIAAVRDYLVERLLSSLDDIILNTDTTCATPAHAHFSFLGMEGEALLMSLDLEGIAVSTGSACASNSLKASHVVVAMGIKVEIAHSSIRFTLGKYSKKEDVDRLIKILPPIAERLRRFNPLYKKSS